MSYLSKRFRSSVFLFLSLFFIAALAMPGGADAVVESMSGSTIDYCETAHVVTELPSTYYSDTTSATAESLTCTSSRAIWFKLSTQTSGTVNINTCGSNYDTYLTLYSGDDCGSLSYIACNDDGGCGGSLRSYIDFEAVSSTTYYVVVSGWSTAYGNVQLNIDGTAVIGDFRPAVEDLDIRRESISSAGAEGDGMSYETSVSSDGRFVAFHSDSSNLVEGDTNNAFDVFVYDNENGTIERVSVSSAGIQGNGHSLNPSISADGRYVAFSSSAYNLVAGDTNWVKDIFVHDRETGVTELVSVATDGRQANMDCDAPSISSDGSAVAFHSKASTLVSNDANDLYDVFVRYREGFRSEGIVPAARVEGTYTERVSETYYCDPWDCYSIEGYGDSMYPSISGDGRFVAFHTFAYNLMDGEYGPFAVSEPGVWSEVAVRDMWDSTIALVSEHYWEGQNGHSEFASISRDGNYIAFHSGASDLVPDDYNDSYDVFEAYNPLGDIFASAGAEAPSAFTLEDPVVRVSTDMNGNEANGNSYHPSISGDGRHVAFESEADLECNGNSEPVVEPFGTGYFNIVVKDMETGESAIASRDFSESGYWANNDSWYASISSDGWYVAFASLADNLLGGGITELAIGGPDTNGMLDVFLTGNPNKLNLLVTTEVENGHMTANPDHVITAVGEGMPVLSDYYVDGEEVELTAVPDDCYEFDYWNAYDFCGNSQEMVGNPVLISMEQDLMIYPVFSMIQYTLTTNVGTPSGSVTAGGTFSCGAEVELTATPDAGYGFTGWSGGLTGTENPATVTMTDDITVTANFVKIWNLNATADTGGSVSADPAADFPDGYYTEGTVVDITATPDDCHTFAGWDNYTTMANPLTVTMDSDISVMALFDVIQYTLTTEVGTGNGSVTAGDVYDCGTVVELTATADEGWEFVGWSGGHSGTANPASVTVTGDMTVTANFEARRYLTLGSTAGGSASANPDNTATYYINGDTVTLTATPDACYVFTGWSGGLTGTTNPVDITMDADKDITANFEMITYTLTTGVNDENGGTVTAGDVYDCGSVVELTATPNFGYVFTGWSGDLTGTTNPASVTMDADKTITANFMRDGLVLAHEQDGKSLTLSVEFFDAGTPMTGALVRFFKSTNGGATWLGIGRTTIDEGGTGAKGVTLAPNAYMLKAEYRTAEGNIVSNVLDCYIGRVELVSPENRTTTTSPAPTATWEAFPEATGYIIEVCPNRYFKNNVSRVYAGNVTSNAMPVYLDGSKTFWRVIAQTADGLSMPSQFRVLTFVGSLD